ncbi:hypothetical protein F4780DRAFT_192740 [Xylariomycetidae sp. FL0641]|nr:hypothetical protein F4780DRAFT_192740 [Xylariomycetidae sp. FL0641]
MENTQQNASPQVPEEKPSTGESRNLRSSNRNMDATQAQQQEQSSPTQPADSSRSGSQGAAAAAGSTAAPTLPVAPSTTTPVAAALAPPVASGPSVAVPAAAGPAASTPVVVAAPGRRAASRAQAAGARNPYQLHFTPAQQATFGENVRYDAQRAANRRRLRITGSIPDHRVRSLAAETAAHRNRSRQLHQEERERARLRRRGNDRDQGAN